MPRWIVSLSYFSHPFPFSSPDSPEGISRSKNSQSLSFFLTPCLFCFFSVFNRCWLFLFFMNFSCLHQHYSVFMSIISCFRQEGSSSSLSWSVGTCNTVCGKQKITFHFCRFTANRAKSCEKRWWLTGEWKFTETDNNGRMDIHQASWGILALIPLN